MCGIAGVIAKTEQASLERSVRNMTEAMRHRGPDDAGYEGWSLGEWNIGFGHCRLSIRDRSAAGHQPMWSDDHRYCVTYNGEIVNTNELRKICEKKRCWNGQSDTETLLTSYDQWGSGAFERYEGMFAFALWDREREEVILARDPLGIKPLYYSVTPDRIVFASEIRAVLASGTIPRQPHPEAIASYLSYGAIQEPSTIFSNVRTLAPGFLVRIRFHNTALTVTEQPFHHILDWPLRGRWETYASALESFGTTLRTSFLRYLVSDVPVGLFLSGGVDSASLASLSSQLFPEGLRTITLTTPGQDKGEFDRAEETSRHYRTRHSTFFVAEEDIPSHVDELLNTLDQPSIDGLNTFLISRAAREHGLTVALSGLGGDELFGGYPSFERLRLLKSAGVIPSFLRAGIGVAGNALLPLPARWQKAWDFLRYGDDATAIYAISRRLFSLRTIEHLFPRVRDGRERFQWKRLDLAPLSQSREPFTALSLHEIRWYAGNMLLRDTDALSMAHGVEVRIPYFAQPVVASALSVPSQWKFQRGRTKPLLLDALNDPYLNRLAEQPKHGFTLPFDRWMRGVLFPRLSREFQDTNTVRHIGLSPQAVQHVWRSYLRAPQQVGWSRPWSLFVLLDWARRHNLSLA